MVTYMFYTKICKLSCCCSNDAPKLLLELQKIIMQSFFRLHKDA